MIKDFLIIALRSLQRRRLRSLLTMIGIIIGIAAVVSLISLGQGMKDAIVSEFENIGSNKLFIIPKANLGSIGDSTNSLPLTINDERRIRSIAGIKETVSYAISSAKITYQGINKYYIVFGIPDEPEKRRLFNDISSMTINQGRHLQTGDKQVATIGIHHHTKGLFDGKNMNIGNRIMINDKKFSVVGIYNPIGNSNDDRLIAIPDNTFRDMFDVKDRVDTIIVEVEDDQDMDTVADNVERTLRRFRNVKAGKEDFSVQTPEDLLKSFEVVLDIVQAVLVGIALVSLFVGSVGIMNSMYTSVLERNKEIGIMKAIGARNSSIFIIFLIESGFLGVAGGSIGVFIGISLAKFVDIISTQVLGKSFLKAHISPELIFGALLFAFVLGTAAGSLPAYRASKLQAAETLRYE